MGKIGVHFKQVVITALQAPLKTGDVGRAQAELAGPFDQEKPAGVTLFLLLNQFGSAVGRAIIHNENVKGLAQGKYGVNDPNDISLFVVSWDND